jgi:hypothetical protein
MLVMTLCGVIRYGLRNGASEQQLISDEITPYANGFRESCGDLSNVVVTK